VPIRSNRFPALACLAILLLVIAQSGCVGLTSAQSPGAPSTSTDGPSITTQPAGQTVTAGQTATFSVTATGTTPLNYQWQRNGAEISGATSPSYTTPATTSSDSGAQFAVVVSNSAGSVTSNTATLTVTTAPVAPSITTQPANRTVTAGQTATFSVTATGTTPLNYQWQRNGAEISGANSASYTTPATTTSDSGAQFTVVVSNSAGSVTSNTATLTVTTAPVAPSITTQPANRTVTAGQTATFSVTATGTTPLTYQWRRNGAEISGANSASYTTPATTTSDSGAQFTVVVSNSTGTVTSNAASLTVNPAPVPPSITTSSLPDGTVGAAYNAGLSATGGTAPYSWGLASGSLPTGLSLNSSGSISGTPTSTGPFPFTIRVRDSSNPQQTATRSFTISVTASGPRITTVSLPSGTVDLAYSATLSATGGVPPYTWSVSAGQLPDGLNLNSSTGMISGTPGMAGQFTFTIQVRDSAAATASATFTITISTSSPIPQGETVPNLKIAFIGDQGNGSNARAVLQLIKDEAAHAVIHSGDFDYADNPTAWDNTITSILGASYPYFASVGNHDVSAWPGYQQKLATRLALVPDATCVGDLGVKSACRFRGLFFLLDGAGTMGSGHDVYLRDQLAADNSVWSICSWHKNQRAMQIGGKSDEVGWEPYEECKKGGAIIATAHEHSYSRTRTLTNIQTQTVDPLWPDALQLRTTPGSTFVFVSGLGGNSIRNQERCLPFTFPYGCNGEWASIYSSDQNAKFGALFITFHVDGDPRKARGYFKTVDGEIVDLFEVFAQ